MQAKSGSWGWSYDIDILKYVYLDEITVKLCISGGNYSQTSEILLSKSQNVSPETQSNFMVP